MPAPGEAIATVEIVNKDGKKLIVNATDLRHWRSKGFKPKGEKFEAPAAEPAAPAAEHTTKKTP